MAYHEQGGDGAQPHCSEKGGKKRSDENAFQPKGFFLLVQIKQAVAFAVFPTVERELLLENSAEGLKQFKTPIWLGQFLNLFGSI